MVVGNGRSRPAAVIATARFTDGGRPAEAPSDAVIQQLTASGLALEDACLAVSHSGMNFATLESVAAARKAGATVVGVCGHAHSTMMEQSDVGQVP